MLENVLLKTSIATTGDNQPSLGHSRPPDRNEQSAISEVQRESDIPASGKI